MMRTVAVALALSAPCESAAPDVPELIARPLSPGSVALLAERRDSPADPAIRQRLSAALEDSKAEVRSAAARVASVRGDAELVQALRKALADEADREAATEEAWALAALDGAAVDPELLAAARRLALGPQIAEILGRARRAGAVAHLSELADLGLSQPDWIDFFELVMSSGGPAGRAHGPSRFRNASVTAWESKSSAMI